MSVNYFFFFLTIRRPPRSTLFSLHDALPISFMVVAHSASLRAIGIPAWRVWITVFTAPRSEEHTSELQSHHDLVCRLLLEKKKPKKKFAHLTKRHSTSHPHPTTPPDTTPKSK